MYDQAQLMLCHCIGGVIPGCGVIFDNSSDGYSCKHAAVCWKYYALYNKLVHSLTYTYTYTYIYTFTYTYT